MSRCIPAINPSLSIPELIKIVKHSFRECDFDEVQKILIDREKRMKIEIENLTMDLDSIKKEARLLERSQNLVESEQLKLVGKLQRFRRKCEELKHQKLVATQTVEELRQKQIEDDKVVEELKRQNREAAKTVDELRRKKIESEKLAEFCKSRLEPRIMKVEERLANMLNVKGEDLANIVNTMEKFAAAKGENVDIYSGDRNLVHTSTSDDGTNTDHTSPGLQSGGSPRVESNGAAHNNEGKGPQVSGKLMFGVQAVDLIEICDNDDETKPGDATYVSDMPSWQKRKKRDCRTKRKRRICTSDKEDDFHIDEKENQIPTHDRIAPLYDVPTRPISDTGLPQSTLPSGPPFDDSQTPLQKFNVLIDVNSTDSDDESSYSDAQMDNLVATVRSKILSRT